MHRRFYYLRTVGETSLAADRAWEEAARATWRCPGCACPKPGQTAITAVLSGRGRRHAHLNIIFSMVGWVIAHIELLDAIGPQLVARNFHVGGVGLADGTKLDDYRTLHGRHACCYLRGGPQSQLRSCDVCGRLLYRPLGDLYLLPCDRGSSLYQSQHGNLLVAASVYEARLRDRKWRGMRSDPIPVLDEPRDELPARTEELIRALRTSAAGTTAASRSRQRQAR
jgi:hypothetical protein